MRKKHFTGYWYLYTYTYIVPIFKAQTWSNPAPSSIKTSPVKQDLHLPIPIPLAAKIFYITPTTT